ncbi:hypothetical protein, partial [Streptococcus anginosus]
MSSIVKQIVTDIPSLTYVESTPKFNVARYTQSTIVEKFELQALMKPNITALKCGHTELTYSQLNSLSNIFARNLITKF